MASTGNLSTVVISGATGWLGRETLERLVRRVSPRPAPDVMAISSNGRSITLESGDELTTQTFENLVLPERIEGFVHLAFLTREKVSTLEYEAYVLTNLKLISNACQVIAQAKPKWVVLVSSGAIFKNGTGELEDSVSENPYGFLKRIEELLIRDVATRVGANIVIGRLWGATGQYMPINRAYAVSDLICQAQTGGPIQIHSRNNVFRRYSDAGEFMDVLIRAAEKGESITLDSGGPLIEIGELASEIALRFPGVTIQREININDPSDDYYPRSLDYEAIANKVGIELSDISEQIYRTCHGHISQLKA